VDVFEIINAAKQPRYASPLHTPTVTSSLKNPQCGDQIELQLVVADGLITAVAILGDRCSIGVVASNIVGDTLMGASYPAILEEYDPVAMLDRLGVPPHRLQCALLPVAALWELQETGTGWESIRPWLQS
jgi:NifU-like protein involved in Fe-S cluster formation